MFAFFFEQGGNLDDRIGFIFWCCFIATPIQGTSNSGDNHFNAILCLLLREKKFCILINLQRGKYTYLYSSVRAKKETKLESN